MDRRPNSFGPVLGYHGCDRAVAEKVLSGNTDLKPSEIAKKAALTAGIDLPKNEKLRESSIYLKRSLDCLVIEYVHAARRRTQHPAYDSVLGVFEEGDRIYDGSGIRQYTHIQIAVRTPEIITGYFRVKGFKKPKS